MLKPHKTELPRCSECSRFAKMKIAVDKNAIDSADKLRKLSNIQQLEQEHSGYASELSKSVEAWWTIGREYPEHVACFSMDYTTSIDLSSEGARASGNLQRRSFLKVMRNGIIDHSRNRRHVVMHLDVWPKNGNLIGTMIWYQALSYVQDHSSKTCAA